LIFKNAIALPIVVLLVLPWRAFARFASLPQRECLVYGVVNAASKDRKTLWVDLYWGPEGNAKHIGHARTQQDGSYSAPYFLDKKMKDQPIQIDAKVTDYQDKVLQKKTLTKTIKSRLDCQDSLDF
jgi:hypothetical protein